MALERWLPDNLKSNPKTKPLPETEKTKKVKRKIQKIEREVELYKKTLNELKISLAIEEQRGRLK